jgi:hypothetical protein
MMLPILQYSNSLEWYDELGRIWKEVGSVTQLRYCHGIFLGGLKKATENQGKDNQ